MKGTEKQVEYAMAILEEVNTVFNAIIEKTNNESVIDMKNRINNANAVQIITAFKNLDLTTQSCTMSDDEIVMDNWKKIRATINVFQKITAKQEGLEKF